MKSGKKMIFVAIAILLFAGGQIVLAQDPAVVNAKFIQVKLDNDKVRVFESTLKPGDQEKMHSHPSSVVYIIEGGKVRNHTPDGKTNEVELKSGDTLYRDPLTHWNENIGTTTIRLIVIELKNPK